MSSPHPQMKVVWLSYKERRVDALALRADERRDKLRKASGRSKYPVIRRCLNGEIKKYEDLPENCRKYVEFVEKHIGFPITMISNGPGRDDIIIKHIKTGCTFSF